MSENKYIVYKHTSPSGKVYIGITCQKTYRRWGSKGQGYSGSKHFWKAIQKYGWDNFTHEILFVGLGEIEAKRLEVELISEYRSNEEEYGYNITSGGGGAAGYKQSADHIRKRTEKTAAKRRGSKLSEEQKQKIAQNNAKYWQGKHRSPETKAKISDSLRGRAIPQEFIQKRKETYRKNHPPKEKPIKKYPKAVAMCDPITGNVISVFESARMAQSSIGVRYQDVSNCAHGRQKTAKGYKWMFVEEVDTNCTTLSS